MRQLIGTAVMVGLLAVAGNTTAAPEMRCRLGGAYIKVYGKTEEQRATCDRQGGEYTHYYPPQQKSGPDPRQQGFNAGLGQRPVPR